MVHTLIQFAVAEKSYMGLGFLEQKWFGRSKDVRSQYRKFPKYSDTQKIDVIILKLNDVAL